MGGVHVGGEFGDWGDESSVNEGDGEILLSKLSQPFLEKFDRRSCNDPHGKGRPSAPAVARTS